VTSPRAGGARTRLVRRAAAARLLLGLLVALPACGDREGVRVQLQSYPVPAGDARQLELRAQVTGRPDGLRYKWFSVNGECEPQETSDPATTFRFASRTVHDRVTVELWRDSARVGRAELDVRLDEHLARASLEPMPEVQIEITDVPPYEPDGGPDTRAEIGGRVSGEVSPGYKVLVYARADAWYVQPTPQASHAVRPGNRWGTWTHTGSSYAALLVRAGFEPFPRLDVLPQVGGDVLARAVVDGVRR